jgi:hypothetical protein
MKSSHFELTVGIKSAHAQKLLRKILVVAEVTDRFFKRESDLKQAILDAAQKHLFNDWDETEGLTALEIRPVTKRARKWPKAIEDPKVPGLRIWGVTTLEPIVEE